MNSHFLIGYNDKDTFLHRLSGSTKLIGFIAFSIIGMITYDTRFLLGILTFSLILFKLSKISITEVSFVIKIIIAFAALNLLMVYVFAPGYGMTIYGTQHMLWRSPENYFNLSWEELFYIFNLFLKYTFAVPLALIFLMTTNPSEFAASLNKIGIPYKTSYAVEIALRYIPNVQRDYRTISLAQQARGYEISKKAKFWPRIIGNAQILLPLIFTSLDRIEVVSQAMELRRFGQGKRRTWYMEKQFGKADYSSLIVIFLIVLAGVALFNVNGGRFWNPFKH
ncbi:energy-coupling factor transporter transmembrane component T family protein [Liquorilactobacillus uvarum]|uniref:ABC transporter permease n=1 Tax=Liquorilactobacillus uvarum DSM 19971 TaxID=1423812 RepID=A0A0R1PZE1_9LACO|nr:energy-coupling factor transporter transmembrane component T [Liquorilactobacillus uvarum]KRL37865.1 ABC transporter permease [Liquorilactobacillus uvarum DSM 19971]